MGEEKTSFSWLREPLKQGVAAKYDTWASSYDEKLESWEYRCHEECATLLQQSLAAGSVLDAGCGTGMSGTALKTRGFTCLGLDISTESLRVAEQRRVYESLKQHDLTQQLPFEDASFDGAVCVGVLAYVDPAEPLLRELCRVVKGIVVFTQRSDLYESRAFSTIIDKLATEGVWDVISVSDPQPYLPGNADFGEQINVIYVACKVLC